MPLSGYRRRPLSGTVSRSESSSAWDWSVATGSSDSDSGSSSGGSSDSGGVDKRDIEPTPTKNRTTVERKSERELVVTRTFNGPARLVFEAWTRPELLKQWWVPKSMGMSLLSLDADVRTGGRYRLVFSHDASTVEFFGKYIEVTPHSRLVWTNEESGDW